jgi:small subunit ribosomal protein S9
MKENDTIIALGIGKRKTSVAKTIFYKGSGNITLNNTLLVNEDIKKIIQQALKFLNLASSLDLNIIVKGGGIYSQLSAIELSISRAIILLNKDYKKILKKEFFLKSDSRIKERRKYGLKKARKAPQYSKR